MDEQRKRNHVGERLKIFAGLAATVFSVTLAVVIGNRLSDEALAVLAGAVCGVPTHNAVRRTAGLLVGEFVKFGDGQLDGIDNLVYPP